LQCLILSSKFAEEHVYCAKCLDADCLYADCKNVAVPGEHLVTTSKVFMTLAADPADKNTALLT
jgi:hypothetical protein